MKLDVKFGVRFELVHQEPRWKEHEEKMTGLVVKLEGQLRCDASLVVFSRMTRAKSVCHHGQAC